MALHAEVNSPVGVALSSGTSPENIGHIAAIAEQLGFGELWISEDLFFRGGIASASAALSATSRLPVGVGVFSAVARHPAVLAMEIAALLRQFPGRFLPGIGLGGPDGVAQMGLTPPSALSALREAIIVVRELLSGDAVTRHGRAFTFDNIQLAHPPADVPPIYGGGLGPKMLATIGEVADGTVVTTLASADYVAWLRQRVAEGQAVAHATDLPHRVVTLALFNLDADADADAAKAKAELRQVIAGYLAYLPESALTDVLGYREQLLDMHARGGDDPTGLIAEEMPDVWVDKLGIAGDAEECAAKIQTFLDAGSDSVALWPISDGSTEETLIATARDVLPRVTARIAK
jgi:5,10-methylenetetrahydromethanopterin reductase